MRNLLVLVGASLLAAALCSPARADSRLAGVYQNLPTAPVTLLACSPRFADSSGLSDYYIGMDASIRDDDPTRVVTIVRFKIDVYDSFANRLSSFSVDASGKFSPGIRVDLKNKAAYEIVTHFADEPYLETINIWPSARALMVSVSEILFADGTIWTAPVQPLSKDDLAKSVANC